MGDRPLITTGVDVSFDQKATLNAALLILVIAVLFGTAFHFTLKALGR